MRTQRLLKHCSRGTTLIEMILYIAIVVVLLIGVGAVSMSAIDAKTKTKAVSDVFSAATASFAATTRIIEGSAVVTFPILAGTSSRFVATSSALGAPQQQIYAESGTLFYASGTGAPVALTPGEVRVENIFFSSVAPGSTTTAVRMSLLLSASTSGVWRSFQYAETFESGAVLGTNR